MSRPPARRGCGLTGAGMRVHTGAYAGAVLCSSRRHGSAAHLIGNRGLNYSVNIVNQQTGAATIAVPLPSVPVLVPSGPRMDWSDSPIVPARIRPAHPRRYDRHRRRSVPKRAIHRIDLTTGAITKTRLRPGSVGARQCQPGDSGDRPLQSNRAIATCSAESHVAGVISIDLATGNILSPLVIVE